VQLGVSRPSVREALIALEVEGRVEVRMGSGIYVREPPVRARGAEHEAESPLETIRAVQLIERAGRLRRAAHAQAAGRRPARGHRVMEEEAAAGHMPTRATGCSTRASPRPARTRCCCGGQRLFDERHNPLFEQLGSHETARSWAAAIEEHRAVVDAIAHQSPARTRGDGAPPGGPHDRFMAGWQAESETPARPAAARGGDTMTLACRIHAARTCGSTTWLAALGEHEVQMRWARAASAAPTCTTSATAASAPS
jgi:hypothetical protein